MTDNINGRTPDEIKRMLRCLSTPCAGECEECEHDVGEPDFTPYDAYVCALELIQQLERERDESWKVVDGLNAQIEGMVEVLESMKRKYSEVCKERNSAVESLRGWCVVCAHWGSEGGTLFCDGCTHSYPFEHETNFTDNWQWCGVREMLERTSSNRCNRAVHKDDI